MANTPFTKKKIQDLQKGLNLTREVIEFDKKTGKFITYPNRKERRDRIFRPLQGLNILFIQQVPIYKYFTKNLKKDKITDKEISKKEYDKFNGIKYTKFIEYKSIIHYKN